MVFRFDHHHVYGPGVGFVVRLLGWVTIQHGVGRVSTTTATTNGVAAFVRGQFTVGATVFRAGHVRRQNLADFVFALLGVVEFDDGFTGLAVHMARDHWATAGAAARVERILFGDEVVREAEGLLDVHDLGILFFGL